MPTRKLPSAALMWNSKLQTTFHCVTAVHTTHSSFSYILALTHCLSAGILSVTLSATTLTDSKQRVLAGSRLKASTSHITNGRYVIHLRKSGLMSLQSSQQPQKMMLLLRNTCKNTAKNNVWSQLSVVVSMMGMLHPPLPTSVWFLSFCSSVHMKAGGTRTGSFSGLLVASVLPHSHCDQHAIYFLITLSLIYHVLKRRIITPRTRIVIGLINTRLKPETSDNRKDGPDDLKVRMTTNSLVFFCLCTDGTGAGRCIQILSFILGSSTTM